MTVHYHGALFRFVRIMEEKLARNVHKRSWRDMSDFWLRDRLRDELDELDAALRGSDPAAIAREAADVANFAMMIADKRRGLR